MGETTLPITGGCLCGAVRYEASEPPGTDGTICHCRICQKAYGNGFAVTADFASKAFRFTRGEPRMYKSSNVGERGFCADCGSPLIMRYTSLPEKVWVQRRHPRRPGRGEGLTDHTRRHRKRDSLAHHPR